MLLVGVVGAVGAGKSTLLGTLAAWWTASGRRADGIVAEACGDRPAEKRGAERYVLHWLATGERQVLAQRDDTQSPPYRFDTGALQRLTSWGDALTAATPAPLVLLDEFGRVEAAGGGLMPLWPKVEIADPEIVVIAVRADCEEEIVSQLGRGFDVRVAAGHAGAWDQLRAACVAHADWSRVGVFGAGAGAVEVTIGSALHGARLPLRGLAMSSTQSAIMAHTGERLGRRPRVIWVPFIAAGLKALSPAGSRVRPMIAITVQGVLFAAATTVLGWNLAGLGLGGALVGMWAAAQGLVLQYLLVGSDLLRAYEAVVRWTAERGFGAPGLATTLAVWISLWGCVSAAVTLVVWRRGALPARLRSAMERGVEQTRVAPGRGRAHAFGAAFRDIARPVFWIPVLIVGIILALAGSPAERLLWIAVRAATIGFLLFAAVRMVDPARVIAWLRGRGYWGPAVAFARAVGGGRDRRGTG
jgi:nucleoside-triphosphatase THEP1